MLSERWIEFGIGSTRLALTVHGRFKDQPPPTGALSLQEPAFSRRHAEVVKCAELLESEGSSMALPVTDQPFGHRTVFFRDPEQRQRRRDLRRKQLRGATMPRLKPP